MKFENISQAASGLYGMMVIEIDGKLVFEDTMEELSEDDVVKAMAHFNKINDEISTIELINNKAREASAVRDAAMLTGADYNGSMISLTDVDGNGVLQVKAGFETGLVSTTIHFKNGTKLPMTAEKFPAFAIWFVTERNKFFI